MSGKIGGCFVTSRGHSVHRNEKSAIHRLATHFPTKFHLLQWVELGLRSLIRHGFPTDVIWCNQLDILREFGSQSSHHCLGKSFVVHVRDCNDLLIKSMTKCQPFKTYLFKLNGNQKTSQRTIHHFRYINNLTFAAWLFWI